MAIDYGSSLGRLRARRLGYDRDPGAIVEAMAKRERYEGRASSAATRYALGAMQAVDPDYTRICREEADRVIAQLEGGLAAVSKTADYRLQGSVPLDVHIRGSSDVDLLVLHGTYITFDAAGARSHTYTPLALSMLAEVIALRSSCEDVLARRNWGATVDTSGSKAIRLSGGAFKREIDVVPAHWNDGVAYQASLVEHDRAVCILDKSGPELLSNLPFLHMRRVEEKDRRTGGGAKMAIRLLKNIKADVDKSIALSSFELAGLAWNCPDEQLWREPTSDLAVLEGIERYLSALASNYSAAVLLRTPDGSRFLIDEPSKFTALVALAAEVSALASAVLAEIVPVVTRLLEGNTALAKVAIPA